MLMHAVLTQPTEIVWGFFLKLGYVMSKFAKYTTNAITKLDWRGVLNETRDLLDRHLDTHWTFHAACGA